MPIVTITSDFNLQSFTIALLKRNLVSIFGNNISIIDIAHNIPPFNHLEASYICASTLLNFPAFSYHIILVDIYDKKPDYFILGFYNNQFYISADNGLLPMTFKNEEVIYFSLPINTIPSKSNLENIFDSISEYVNSIEADKNLLHNFSPLLNFEIKKSINPNFDHNYIDGQIISIDSFENVILNITQEQFEETRRGRKFKISLMHNEIIDELKTYYSDVPEGEKLAFFNHAGYLEIAINKGNAAGLLGFLSKPNDKNLPSENLFYKTIRIYFE